MSSSTLRFCGVNMLVDAYNDDLALRDYVLHHFPHLMTSLERRVTEYIAPIVSNSDNEKVRKLYAFLEERDGHVDDDAVAAAFQATLVDRRAQAVERILATRRNQVIENRCGRCNRLARTPAARQCLWCGHDWH